MAILSLVNLQFNFLESVGLLITFLRNQHQKHKIKFCLNYTSIGRFWIRYTFYFCLLHRYSFGPRIYIQLASTFF